VFDESTTGEGNDRSTTELSGQEEVFKLLKPYVSVQCENNYNKLSEILETLGVSNMSHIEILDEKDFGNVIKAADFRFMKKKIYKDILGRYLR